jgi:PAS domain S-box-containing protein
MTPTVWVNLFPSLALAVDAEGRVTAANDAIARCLACTQRQLLATELTAWAADPAALHDFLQIAADTPGEFCLNAADGGERWLQISIGKRAVVGETLLAAFDVTARRAHSDKMDEENRRFRDIVGVGGGTLYEMNADLTRIRMWERDTASGMLTIRERDAKFPDEVIDPAFNPAGLGETQRRYAAREPVHNLIYRLPGKEVYRLGNSVPFYDSDGLYQGRRGVSIDVTAQVLAERALVSLAEELSAAKHLAEQARATAETASRAKSEFLAKMSHELRTPLNAVIGYSEMLLEEIEAAGYDQYSADLKHIHSAGQHLLSLVSDVLDLSKLEAGKMELEAIDFDLVDMVETAARLLEPKAHKKGINLSVLIDPAARGGFHGDPTRLRQILLNLVSNAVKFTDRGGVSVEAVLRAATPGEPPQLRFEVSDTGIGISEDTRGNLFQKFSQADSSIARRFGGAGLGLAISKQLLELMGGRIGIESTPGRGSLFWFEVPLPPALNPTVTRTALPAIVDDHMARQAVREAERLRDREARLRQMMEHLDRVQRIAGIGSTTMDLATGLIEWSAEACAIFGIGSDTIEPTVEFLRSFVHPDDRAKVVAAAEGALAMGVAAAPLEYRIIRPDGAVRIVYRENDVQRDQSGRPIRRIVTFKDITELKATEAQLGRTKEHLARAQRISGVGSMERDLRTGQATCSEEFCRILGVDPDGFRPSLKGVMSFVHPDDRAMVEMAVYEADRAGVAMPPLEFRIIRRDGEVRTVNRETDVQRDPEGRAICRILTFKDITELKATEVQLRETMDNLARAQRLAHAGSDSRDLTNHHVEWSDETYRIFGVDPKDFILTTQKFLNMVIPEDRPKILTTWEEIARGQTPAPFEYRIRRPNGEIRCIHRICELITDQNGAPIRVVGTIRDVTELREAEHRQKELEHQLLHSQKLEAVGTLAGGVAHELNNALVPIVALSRMVLEDLPPASEAREDLEKVVQASQRAQGLVRGILAFSRKQEAEKQEAEKQEVDLVQLVRQSLAMLCATMPATIQIDEELTPVPPVPANPDQLQQVIVNLVTNGVHAIGHAIGAITIGLEMAGPEQSVATDLGKRFVRLRIADTGCGMNAKTVERIFEPFYTTKEVGEGTGLGLSVVHGIITGHGGRIDVQSEPGKGTEFSIYLPLALTLGTELLVEAAA